MLENTKHKLDPRLEVAFLYLKDHCEANGAILNRKFVKTTSGKIVIICTAENGTYASLGIDKDDRFKIFAENQNKKRWAKLEGFTEPEMYEALEHELIEEVTLVELARQLVS